MVGAELRNKIFYSYPLIWIVVIVCLQCTRRYSLKQILTQQFQYLLCYCLATLNMVFAWHGYQVQGIENSIHAWGTYTMCHLEICMYSLFLPTSIIECSTIILCASCRLIAYGIQTSRIISEDEVVQNKKDFYLAFIAIQTAIYTFFIEEARKPITMRIERMEK